MSFINEGKELTCSVQFSDDTYIEYDIELEYQDDDSMAVAEIEVNITPAQTKAPLDGMAKQFEDDVRDALDTYFTKNYFNIGDRPDINFDFNTITLEVYEDNGDYSKGTIKVGQELIDKVLEQMKKDIEVGDLTAIDELLTFVPIRNLKGYLAED